MQNLTVNGEFVYLLSLDGGVTHRKSGPQRWALVKGNNGRPRRVRWEHINIRTRDADEWED